ncbi:MAG: 16S rRNA (uracil(1498)-N(3))-methyltransferase [Alphaproteobacteria bacterium]|nr:16S rRNA (uracil(1498)-N(3))-methyltransferase [Alphaproteobacteria bacterium]
MAKTFRLYTKEDLEPNKTILLNEEQTHYLKNVVKYSLNDTLLCFDNKSGEFLCEIQSFNKKTTEVIVKSKTKDFASSPDIWLLFAPLKKDKTDFVIEKATELGVRKIIPTLTRYTITNNIKTERYHAQAIEASEQSRRTDIPEISQPQTLSNILSNWDSQRTLFFMDETLQSLPFLEQLQKQPSAKSAILIGPEGGFSDEELSNLRTKSFAKGATLGPRILRAETAALSALSCWQMILGDWRK